MADCLSETMTKKKRESSFGSCRGLAHSYVCYQSERTEEKSEDSLDPCTGGVASERTKKMKMKRESSFGHCHKRLPHSYVCCQSERTKKRRWRELDGNLYHEKRVLFGEVCASKSLESFQGRRDNSQNQQ